MRRKQQSASQRAHLRGLGIVVLAGLLMCLQACKPGSSGSSCVDCHAPPGAADGVGIEEIHPWLPVPCVDCHGGDASKASKEEAHLPVPDGIAGPTDLRSFSSLELDGVNPDYVRWVNPSDYRVTEQTCGLASCHQAISEAAPTSIMTTFAGHMNKTRYYAGLQESRQAYLGVRSQTDTEHGGEAGTTQSLAVLDPPRLTEDSPFGDFVDHYLEKGCPRCHVWNFGPNDVRGDFRSSGCAGCHVLYHADGLSRSADPNANRDDPPHPQTHTMTTRIPDAQCEHCHYRGNRIGTMFRGAREIGRIGNPPNPEGSTESIHGREPGFYLLDEDISNLTDETPPDLHYSAGMGCVDCHVGQDVHGNGRLYSAHDYQVGVECEDCHGTQERAITPDEQGVFRTTVGNEMETVRLSASGVPELISRIDGQAHPLRQLVDLALDGSNPELLAAHGRDDRGFSHLDRIECYTCHTSWTQSCFGCHVTVDLRNCDESLIDGEQSDGLASGERTWVTLDYIGLGMGVDGKITPMAPQEKMYFTVIAPCDPKTQTCTDGVDSPSPGRRIFDQKVRITHDGKLGMGYGPVVPHTTSSTSQPCDRCHLREDGTNQDIVNESLGRGSGRFIIPDGDGVEYDLTKVVDEQGNALVGLAHEGTDVLPPDIVERMLSPRVPNSGLTLKQFPLWEAP